MLAKQVYLLISVFPEEERFGLIDQIRRASVSMLFNLAEGCGRMRARDQAHFSQLAFGSLLELVRKISVLCALQLKQAE